MSEPEKPATPEEPAGAPPPPSITAPSTEEDKDESEISGDTFWRLRYYALCRELRSRASALPVLASIVDAAVLMTAKRPTKSEPLNLLLRAAQQTIAEVRAFQGDQLPGDDPLVPWGASSSD